MQQSRDDAEAEYTRTAAETASREAVRAAEEVASDAWLAALSSAEEESLANEQICVDLRDTAYQVFKASASGTAPAGTSASSMRELASAQLALARFRDRRTVLRRFAEQERLAVDAAAEARRLEAARDREQLAAAARASGLRERFTDHGELPENG